MKQPIINCDCQWKDCLEAHQISLLSILLCEHLVLTFQPVLLQVYYIFRGGGRCYYCATDDSDYRKLSIGSDQSGILPSTADEILNDVGVPAFSSGLRGVVPVEQQRGLDKDADRIELYQPFSEELWTEDDADFDPKDPTPFAAFDDNHTDSEDNENMHNGSTADGRNLQDDEMCGCHHVEFDRDGKNREIWGTPYIPTDEWRTRHGFDVYVGYRVEDGKRLGYAPGKRARIYDTDKMAAENPDFNYNLGSPNYHCGGLGRGAGGRPFLSNGEPNPGANCVPQGKVLIVQEAKKINADAADLGGDILFHFKRGPVTLKAIGLLDVESSTRAEIKVWQLNENGKHVISRFHPKGYGGNAVETMNFDLKDVLKVRVRFQDTAAVTMISFCYDKYCTRTREEPPADAIEAFDREVRPHIESSAIFHITNAIMAESMGKDGANFCLSPTETSVDVDMEVTTSPREACRYS